MLNFKSIYKSGAIFTGTFIFCSNVLCGFHEQSLKEERYKNYPEMWAYTLTKTLFYGSTFPLSTSTIAWRGYKSVREKDIGWLYPSLRPNDCHSMDKYPLFNMRSDPEKAIENFKRIHRE